MLRKIEVRWLDGITDSLCTSLSKFQGILKDRKAWCAAVTESGTTEGLNNSSSARSVGYMSQHLRNQFIAFKSPEKQDSHHKTGPPQRMDDSQILNQQRFHKRPGMTSCRTSKKTSYKESCGKHKLILLPALTCRGSVPLGAFLG